MPEMRKDIVTGCWVVVATARARRPGDLIGCPEEAVAAMEEPCPFCPGNETMTPPEVMAVRPPGSKPDTPGWSLRVVPNKYPAFSLEREGESESGTLFPSRPATGIHEVIVHSPSHTHDLEGLSKEEVVNVVETYRERYRLHAADPLIKYIQIIINHGRGAGASQDHPHSQLFGIPIVPPVIRNEITGSSRYGKRRGSCVFCDIIAREISEGERVISEYGSFLVYTPFASRLPFEACIIPRYHQGSLGDMNREQVVELASVIKETLVRYEDRLGGISYNLFTHSAPCDGKDYGSFHWHLVILPRLTVPGGFEWGTGVMINVVRPEDAAEFLRGE